MRYRIGLVAVAALVAATAGFAAESLQSGNRTEIAPESSYITGAVMPAWQITPRPPLLKVLPEGPCPSTARGFNDVFNARAGLSQRLLPSGALFGHICRYGTERGSRPFNLVRSAVINGRTALAFESAVGGLRTTRPPVSSCPAQFATVTVLSFGYADGSSVELWYNDTGCETLDNGRLEAGEVADPAFYDGFTKLVDLIAPTRYGSA